MAFEGADTSLLPKRTSDNVRTLFDWNIPREINERIIHFLSHRPSYVYPKCYVNASDLMAVLRASDEVRSVVLNQFHSVSAVYLEVHKKSSIHDHSCSERQSTKALCSGQNFATAVSGCFGQHVAPTEHSC